MRLRLRFIREMRELESVRPFYGIMLTWFHRSHNLRIYFGLNPAARRLRWLPQWRTYPYSLKKSVELRRVAA